MVITEPMAVGTNAPTSPNRLPTHDLPRPTTIDSIAHLINSAKNANLSADRRRQIVGQLTEYQRALRQGAVSARKEIAQGVWRDQRGKELFDNTPSGIVDLLLEKHTLHQHIDLFGDKQTNPQLANTRNAAMVAALGMLPQGVTADRLIDHLSSSVPTITCHDDEEFRIAAQKADETGTVTSLILQKGDKHILTAFRGFRNDALGGVTLGFMFGHDGVGLTLPRQTLANIIQPTLQET